jgi:hypothetical protein
MCASFLDLDPNNSKDFGIFVHDVEDPSQVDERMSRLKKLASPKGSEKFMLLSRPLRNQEYMGR